MIEIRIGTTEDNEIIVFMAGPNQIRFPTADVPAITRSLRALVNQTVVPDEHDLRTFYKPPNKDHPKTRIGIATEPAVILNKNQFRTPPNSYLMSFAEALKVADRLDAVYQQIQREGAKP